MLHDLMHRIRRVGCCVSMAEVLPPLIITHAKQSVENTPLFAWQPFDNRIINTSHFCLCKPHAGHRSL